jgi:hypothetical protein
MSRGTAGRQVQPKNQLSALFVQCYFLLILLAVWQMSTLCQALQQPSRAAALLQQGGQKGDSHSFPWVITKIEVSALSDFAEFFTASSML